MKQYLLIGNTLTLKVKKAPILVRTTLAFLSLFSFLAPVVGLIYSISAGNKSVFGNFIGIAIFGGLAYYLLKMFLWNTCGSETIVFKDIEVSYQSNYGLFKGDKKTIPSENLFLKAIEIGWKEDKKGNLIIVGEDDQINSVVKIPIQEIDMIIKKLHDQIKVKSSN